MPPYRLMADAVLLVHVAVVFFVVGGLVLVVAGNCRGWKWVNRPWFRLAHLAAIAVVVTQSWIGLTCPLTELESWLRLQAGVGPYAQGFIEHWLGRLIFFEAPAWVFTAAYAIFGTLVAAAWWVFPPDRTGSRR